MTARCRSAAGRLLNEWKCFALRCASRLSDCCCDFFEVSSGDGFQGVTEQRGVMCNPHHGSEDEEEGTREMRISHEAHRP